MLWNNITRCQKDNFVVLLIHCCIFEWTLGRPYAIGNSVRVAKIPDFLKTEPEPGSSNRLFWSQICSLDRNHMSNDDKVLNRCTNSWISAQKFSNLVILSKSILISKLVFNLCLPIFWISSIYIDITKKGHSRERTQYNCSHNAGNFSFEWWVP